MLLSRTSAALALLAVTTVVAGAADHPTARFVSKLDTRGRDSLYPETARRCFQVRWFSFRPVVFNRKAGCGSNWN
jgi:hypothetical protein